jgi:hypothetical protein
MKTIKIEMTLKKSTKNTHVYGNEDSVVPSVYIRKEAFPIEVPQHILLTIEDDNDE